jgi:hypothetical protein
MAGCVDVDAGWKERRTYGGATVNLAHIQAGVPFYSPGMAWGGLRAMFGNTTMAHSVRAHNEAAQLMGFPIMPESLKRRLDPVKFAERGID